MVAANDQGGRREAKPLAHAPQAPRAWSIPEIRVVKDDQGRLRIDQSDPATYGAYAARQLQATAEADSKYRDGMTKHPSTPSIRITYVNGVGEPQEIGVREIFCRMDGDALVLTQFMNAAGEKVKDLPLPSPGPASSMPMWTTWIGCMKWPWPSSVMRRYRLPRLNRNMRHPSRRPLGNGGVRLGHFGNMTRRPIRPQQRARSRLHQPLSRRRAVQQLCRLLQRRRERQPAPRPIRRYGRSTTVRRPRCVR